MKDYKKQKLKDKRLLAAFGFLFAVSAKEQP
jgi:hypothetical protein